MRPFTLTLLAFLISCSSPKPQTEAARPEPAKPAAKPADESRRFPKANLVDTEVVDDHLMGKAFMPGGTLAHYKAGKTGYDLFVARMASPTDAAIALSDWRKSLTDPKLVASFGGYFGKDAGTPVFVFTKGAWVAGVKGLSEKSSDLPARTLAAQLPQ